MKTTSNKLNLDPINCKWLRGNKRKESINNITNITNMTKELQSK